MSDLKKLCEKINKANVFDAEVIPKGWFSVKQLSKEMNLSECQTMRRVNAMFERKEIIKKKFRVATSRGTYPVNHFRNVSTK